MKSLAITGTLIAAALCGSSWGNDPVHSGSGGAAAGTQGNPRAYLGKESDLISRIVLRPGRAIVLLSEPCGAQSGYSRARLFSYEPKRRTPAAERDGCYDRRARDPAPNGTIIVYQSDGATLGKPILQVPVAEAFVPRFFFLPFEAAARHLRPKVVALGEFSSKHPTAYASVGLTGQPCPAEPAWRLARQLPEDPAAGELRCWQERGNSIVLRDIHVAENALPQLAANEELIGKAAFFAAATLATIPVKYDWSSR